MTRDDLARAIVDCAHVHGEFRLRSGAVSSTYFDKFLLAADPVLLRRICEAMARLVPPGAEAIAAIPYGGWPVATVLSQVTGLPARYVRREAKEYGTGRLVEGGDIADLGLAVVEDVVTSGGALLESCAALRDLGARIDAVLCVVDREQGGGTALQDAGLELRALYPASELAAV